MQDGQMAVGTQYSAPSRVADSGEGIGLDELALAARNHAMPLEALRYDVTPIGMHYLLVHYDIPDIDPATWRLRIGGGGPRGAFPSPRDPRSGPPAAPRGAFGCARERGARPPPPPPPQPRLGEG